MKRFWWGLTALALLALLIGIRGGSDRIPHPEFLGEATPVDIQDFSDAAHESPYAEVYSLRRPYSEVLAEARHAMAGWAPVAIDRKKAAWQAGWQRTTAKGRIEKIAIADMRRYDAHYGKKTVPPDGRPMVTVIVSQEAHPRHVLSQLFRFQTGASGQER